MRIVAVIVVLLASFTELLAQQTLYYDKEWNITTKELSTHYRVGLIDSAAGRFMGEVTDYWSDGTAMLKLVYDDAGRKHGAVRASGKSGKPAINGQYAHGQKTCCWEVISLWGIKTFNYAKKEKSNNRIDSLEAIILKKEKLEVSRYVRKADYPGIAHLLIKSYSNFKPNSDFVVEREAAYFFGGKDALYRFIDGQRRYPEEAGHHNVNGQVSLEFVVTESGVTIDHKVVQGLGYGCDEEAIRLAMLLPDWVPAYDHGKAVRSTQRLAIPFRKP